jgi:ribosomal protein S18 acetylase RimI-like enzyme
MSMASPAGRVEAVLRIAGPADSRRLALIAQEAYGKYAGLLDEPPAPTLLDYDAVAAAGRTYVAVESGEIEGMVTVEESDGYLILRNLAVRPAAQRKGIGRRLVALVEELAATRRLAGVRLWTRAEMSDNIAFYRGLDYALTHVERSATATRVHLRKELARPRDGEEPASAPLTSVKTQRSGSEP